MRIICPHFSSYCVVVLIFYFFFSLKNQRQMVGKKNRQETSDVIEISCATGNCFWPIVLPIKTAGGQLKNRWQSANIKSATNSETESSNFVSIESLLSQKALHAYSDSARFLHFCLLQSAYYTQTLRTEIFMATAPKNGVAFGTNSESPCFEFHDWLS